MRPNSEPFSLTPQLYVQALSNGERFAALRFEEAFIGFIQSGEQRMVIDESLTGFGVRFLCSHACFKPQHAWWLTTLTGAQARSSAPGFISLVFFSCVDDDGELLSSPGALQLPKGVGCYSYA